MFKQTYGRFCLIICLLFSATVFAKEPTNLGLFKSKLIEYHDSGAYAKDIDAVVKEATAYLLKRLANPKPSDKKLAIVLDIDETCLSNYPDMFVMNFGGSLKETRAAENQATNPVIAPTLALFRLAKANNVAVFFITGRYPEQEEPTILNLKKVGYDHWDGLFFKPKPYWTKSAAKYKTKIRKELSDLGYQIILNMGDQYSDLEGGFAEKTFKLPGPFYFIA